MYFGLDCGKVKTFIENEEMCWIMTIFSKVTTVLGPGRCFSSEWPSLNSKDILRKVWTIFK